jgi:RES domain-containing protein
LAHAGIGRVPRIHVAAQISIANGVKVDNPTAASLPLGWDDHDLILSRAWGDAWIREKRTAVLVVSSVAARREGNMLLKPQHPSFKQILAAPPEPVVWDSRLFSQPPQTRPKR